MHGTHRPNSLKKTVIKRRKRVPAATNTPISTQTHTFVPQQPLPTTTPPSSATMSDRDAAEALDALGKAGRRSAPIHQHPSQEAVFDSDQAQEPQRKRVRRTKSSGTAASDRESSVSPGQREDNAARITDDVQRDREEYERNTLTPVGTHTWEINQHPHAHSGGSPHGHGGFDLPPLAELDVLSGAHPHSHPHHHMVGSNRSFSYPSSGARTHSPHDAHQSGHQNTAAQSPTGTPQGSLHLPPLSHAHPHTFLPSHLSQARSRGAETHAHMAFAQHQHQPQQQQHIHQTGSFAEQQHQLPTPTYSELAAHYGELHEERRRLEGLLAKTNDMMRGVKRGLDELRAAGAPGSAAPQESLRLPSRERREREVVWRVEGTEA